MHCTGWSATASPVYAYHQPNVPALPLSQKVLETLRASGRTVFLATNSLFDYTNVVMNFLLSGKTGEAAAYLRPKTMAHKRSSRGQVSGTAGRCNDGAIDRAAPATDTVLWL